MANTYSDATGVLLFNGPAKITPVIRMLFAPFKLDDSEGDDNERYVAVLSEDNNYDWDSYIEEVIKAAQSGFGIEFSGQPTPVEAVQTIAAHFGADIAELLPSIDFDGYAVLSDVVALALLLDDGHNLVGVSLEGCWHGDRPRLGEFGGWATYASSRYFLSLASSDVSCFARKIDAAAAESAAATARELSRFTQQLVDGIVDPGQRALVARLLVRELKRKSDGEVADVVAIQAPPESAPAWTRTVYLEAYATDNGSGPGYASLEVTPGLIHKVQALRALCREVGLTEVRVTGAPQQWGPGTSEEELRLTSSELVVTPLLFWFEDVPEHMPFHIETACQDIDRFVEAVCGPGEPLYLGIDPEDVAEQNASDS